VPCRLRRLGNQETILVVEDEEVVRMLVCAVLTDAATCALRGWPVGGSELVRTRPNRIDLLGRVSQARTMAWGPPVAGRGERAAPPEG
jgi:hypothetical protein